jgi:NADPH:quinone reductase-like Zn-dependent oxidoreductase
VRAAVRTRYGPPDVVRVRDVPAPVPADGELLVRVHATTVNRTDCGFRAGHPAFIRLLTGFRPRATVLGTEFAGVVDATGPAVTSFAPGDRVFGYSEGRNGAHAEYTTVAADGMVATLPAGFGFEEAAPMLEGAHYAMAFLRVAPVRGGQDVLVYGATGAIGSAAVQLARQLGAHVTAVCPEEHVALVQGLGAERVVGLTDWPAHTDRYDVVIDAVGKSSFGRCRRLLRRRGVYLSSDLGPWSQNPFLALVSPLSPGRKVKFPLPQNRRDMALWLRELAESGAYRPVLDPRRYPLERIAEAYEYAESGRKLGNVVVTVAG